jgi:hypothetical protein
VSQAPPTTTDTLGATLERERLEHRLSRVAVVITTLHQRASQNRGAPGARPRHIQYAIADFETQMAAMNVRLRELAPGRGSSPPQERCG